MTHIKRIVRVREVEPIKAPDFTPVKQPQTQPEPEPQPVPARVQ